MGSLRTELQIPSMFPSAQSIEERAESDDGAEEVEGEDEMLLGSTPSERFQVYTAVTSNPYHVSYGATTFQLLISRASRIESTRSI